MRVVFAAAELEPVAKVGGLAVAAAGLARALRSIGIDLELVMPDYGGIELGDERRIELEVPEWVGTATMRSGHHAAVGELHLIDLPGMARPHPYLDPSGAGWVDNSERFFRFARAVAAWIELAPPDVVHLNDWHTGPALAALAAPPASVVTIHNLAYQGVAGGEWLARLGPRAAHFEWYGGTNPLAGALALADRIVAVSPTYATEITTPDGGFGLDGPLRARGSALVGILNGIDTESWNPATDPHLPVPFDHRRLPARSASRAALLERVGLPDDGAPVATVVTRLAHQKGIDLLVPIVPLLDQIPLRLVILGAGDAAEAGALHGLATEFPDHLAFVEGYDDPLTRLMFAGADLYVMPSRFEPCGLTQLQAMRYGAIPVVTAVGGLVDTVPDVDRDPDHGHGIVAAAAEPLHLLAALHRGVRLVRDKRRCQKVQRRIMQLDWSWDGPARRYAELYDSIVRR